MKKMYISVVLAALLVVLFAGCEKKSNFDDVALISFSGQDGKFSLINGIIVSTEDEMILSGGNLTYLGDEKLNITKEVSKLIILKDGYEFPLMDFTAISEQGGIEAPHGLGTIQGGMGIDELENINENLYLKIELETIDGKTMTHEIKMDVVDVTGSF